MASLEQDVDLALSAFADAALGGRLAPDVEALLRQAGGLRQHPEQALSLLQQACELAPNHPAPLIALYRFHFFGHELARARQVGEQACAIARLALGPALLEQAPTAAATRYDAAVRFYLFTLKGLAYLNLRLGELAQAQLLLAELRRLDPDDHVGGAVLAQVLQRQSRLAACGEDGADDEFQDSRARVGWSEVL
jgi:Tfp pilus assembly protein PilF